MLLEQMEKETTPSPLMTSGEETRAMSALRSGNDLRPKDETSFWEEFINLCANSDGMADLLEVTPDKVRRWSRKIRELLNQIQNHDAQDPAVKDDVEMMPTGDTGAVTANANSDPVLGLQ